MESSNKRPVVYVMGTCDTKLRELLAICSHLESLSAQPFLVDVGRHRTDHHGIAYSIASQLGSQPAPVDQIIAGLTSFLSTEVEKHAFHCALAIGGSSGSSTAAPALRALPLGFPKMLLSTMAAGDVSPYVGEADLTLTYSVVDLAGSNSLLDSVLRNAAGAAAGMAHVYFRSLESPPEAGNDERGKNKPKTVAISMFGVTTPACDTARALLEERGYAVLVFHATGAGGRALERLVREGDVDGVLDLTTSELADEMLGGVLSAGPSRLTAAGQKGIPQVVSTGALDMVNFGPADSVPERYRNRTLWKHNEAVTLVRTTVQERRDLGRVLGEKVREGKGRREVWVPLGGCSGLSEEGKEWCDPEAERAALEGIHEGVEGEVAVVARETGINDERFAREVAERLVELMNEE